MAALLWHLIEVMHMVRDDLTGQRFGKLVVLKELGGGRILCRCDCGREKGFNKSNVKRGLAKSCGSCVRQHTRRDLIKDIVGRRFGKLVVLKELGYRRVLCRCDCGNVKEINKSHLLSGDIVSCGCEQKMSAIKARASKLYKGTDINKISTATATSRSTTGIRGVSYSTRREKYRANIGFRGQKFELGYFDTIEEAAKARKAAEERLYKPLIEEWRDKNAGQQKKGK